MNATRVLLKARQPMIKFIGKRAAPPKDATSSGLQPHPAAPTHSLPESFASYREKATQHGPLKTTPAETCSRPANTTISYGRSVTVSGHSLGSVAPVKGQYFDRSELPQRFQRMVFSMEEMEAIESGGASMFA